MTQNIVAFFPRVLVHLVGLELGVFQGVAVPPRVGGALEAVPELEQLGAIAVQFPRQPGGGRALGDAADDQEQLGGPAAGPAVKALKTLL